MPRYAHNKQSQPTSYPPDLTSAPPSYHYPSGPIEITPAYPPDTQTAGTYSHPSTSRSQRRPPQVPSAHQPPHPFVQVSHTPLGHIHQSVSSYIQSGASINPYHPPSHYESPTVRESIPEVIGQVRASIPSACVFEQRPPIPEPREFVETGYHQETEPNYRHFPGRNREIRKEQPPQPWPSGRLAQRDQAATDYTYISNSVGSEYYLDDKSKYAPVPKPETRKARPAQPSGRVPQREHAASETIHPVTGCTSRVRPPPPPPPHHHRAVPSNRDQAAGSTAATQFQADIPNHNPEPPSTMSLPVTKIYPKDGDVTTYSKIPPRAPTPPGYHSQLPPMAPRRTRRPEPGYYY